MTLGDESRRASGLLAHIRSETSVGPDVCLEIALFVESLSAFVVGADEGLIPKLIYLLRRLLGLTWVLS